MYPQSKKSQKKGHQYFNCELQFERGLFKQVCCFDASKHAEMRSAQDSANPVSLGRIRIVPSRGTSGSEDVLLNKTSTVCVSPHKFEPKESQPKVCDLENQAVVEVEALMTGDFEKVSFSLLLRGGGGGYSGSFKVGWGGGGGWALHLNRVPTATGSGKQGKRGGYSGYFIKRWGGGGALHLNRVLTATGSGKQGKK